MRNVEIDLRGQGERKTFLTAMLAKEIAQAHQLTSECHLTVLVDSDTVMGQRFWVGLFTAVKGDHTSSESLMTQVTVEGTYPGIREDIRTAHWSIFEESKWGAKRSSGQGIRTMVDDATRAAATARFNFNGGY